MAQAEWEEENRLSEEAHAEREVSRLLEAQAVQLAQKASEAKSVQPWESAQKPQQGQVSSQRLVPMRRRMGLPLHQQWQGQWRLPQARDA